MDRRKLRRRVDRVRTEFGDVPVKVGMLNGAVIQVSPEYESCRQLAAKEGVPLKTVYEAALRLAGPAAGKRKGRT
jgi:uncharacterized protein (DUF111 family)